MPADEEVSLSLPFASLRNSQTIESLHLIPLFVLIMAASAGEQELDKQLERFILQQYSWETLPLELKKSMAHSRETWKQHVIRYSIRYIIFKYISVANCPAKALSPLIVLPLKL